MPDQPGENHDPEFEAMLQKALKTSKHDEIERAVDQITPDDDVPEGHKSGYVAVVGKPNVGKSTLINQILGEKIAIVSPKPQTTRIRQLGILTRDDMQVIFIDTPGIHRAQDDLGSFMVDVAKSALDDADVILYVNDISTPPDGMDRQVAEYIQAVHDPGKIIHVLNKVDAQRDPEKFQRFFEAYRKLVPEDTLMVSTIAKEGHHVDELLEKIIERLPEGPRYFPADQVSDLSVRLITADMIREQVLRNTKQEVPHAVAVEVEEFKQRRDDLIYIGATIYVEREGQKGIIVGKGGEMLKKISTAARKEIEEFVGTKVFLELWVRVLPNWRQNPAALQRFGYRL